MQIYTVFCPTLRRVRFGALLTYPIPSPLLHLTPLHIPPPLSHPHMQAISLVKKSCKIRKLPSRIFSLINTARLKKETLSRGKEELRTGCNVENLAGRSFKINFVHFLDMLSTACLQLSAEDQIFGSKCLNQCISGNNLNRASVFGCFLSSLDAEF